MRSGKLWCPVVTADAPVTEVPLKSYKLGHPRSFYNKVVLQIRHTGCRWRKATIVECKHLDSYYHTLTREEQGYGIEYQVRLRTGHRVFVKVFVVKDEPEPVHLTQHGRTVLAYKWPAVTRCSECLNDLNNERDRVLAEERAGILQALELQEMIDGCKCGWSDNLDPEIMVTERDSMYLCIDEACSHVASRDGSPMNEDKGPRRKGCFRLVAGMYRLRDLHLLATGMSPAVSVIAHNEAADGAASIPLAFKVEDDWKGWRR